MIDAYVDGRPMPSSSSALHQRRLGVARRRLRGVAVRLDVRRGQRQAFGELGQLAPTMSRVGLGVVVAEAVGRAGSRGT